MATAYDLLIELLTHEAKHSWCDDPEASAEALAELHKLLLELHIDETLHAPGSSLVQPQTYKDYACWQLQSCIALLGDKPIAATTYLANCVVALDWLSGSKLASDENEAYIVRFHYCTLWQSFTRSFTEFCNG